MLLLRVEPDQSLTEMGEHSPIQGEYLAYHLSADNPGIEYLLDNGRTAHIYRDGVYQGWIASSTGR
jgi:hypothetical protein